MKPQCPQKNLCVMYDPQNPSVLDLRESSRSANLQDRRTRPSRSRAVLRHPPVTQIKRTSAELGGFGHQASTTEWNIPTIQLGFLTAPGFVARLERWFAEPKSEPRPHVKAFLAN